MRIRFLFLFSLLLTFAAGQTGGKNLGSAGEVQSFPCINEGFESTSVGAYTGASNSLSVSGWTLSGAYKFQSGCAALTYTNGAQEFSIAATPFTAAVIGTVSNSPLGGTRVACLNANISNSSAVRLSQHFPVTSGNCYLMYAIAAVSESGETCCEGPASIVNLLTPLGSPIACLSKTYSPNCGATMALFNNNVMQWHTEVLDLTPYIGTSLIIEVISTDCYAGGHRGFTFFDADCGADASRAFGGNYCTGGTNAQIIAPPGSGSYSWSVPSGVSVTGSSSQQTLNAQGVSAGMVFTVAMVSAAGCSVSLPYVLNSSSISVTGSSVSSSCQFSANGSATVFVSGVPSYSSTWTGTAGLAGTTGSVSPGLAPGPYTVVASSIGCGTASATFTIPAVSTSYSLMPAVTPTVCTGDSVQFTVILPASSSPAQFSYTWQSGSDVHGYGIYSRVIPAVASNSFANLTYSVVVSPTVLACPATMTFAVLASNPLQPVVSLPALLCSDGPTVQATYGPPGGSLSLVPGSVSPSGVVDPALQSVGPHVLLYKHALSGCSRTASVHLQVVSPPVLVITGASSVCAGGTVVTSVAGAHTYSWYNGANTSSITHTPGSALNMTVLGTSTLTGCSTVKSFTILSLPLPFITITGPQAICSGETVTLTAAGAAGYTWTGSPFNAPELTISPLASGIYTVTGVSAAGCSATAQHTVQCVPVPTLTILAPLMVCAGDPFTLQAGGAETLIWSGSGSGATITASLSAGHEFTLTGINQGVCQRSVTAKVNVSPCTGIQTTSLPALKVFPVPFTSVLYCEVPEPGELRITDVSGREIFYRREVPTGVVTVDLSAYSSGLFYVRFGNANRSDVRKVTKD